MFYRRIAELEKDLGTSDKLFPLCLLYFAERQDSLTAIMADWGKSRV